jgi:hypothetical protein
MAINTFLNGVLVETFVDNGDGTGVLTDLSTMPPTVTEITGVPIEDSGVDLSAALDLLASMPQEQLQRVLSLGVLLTEETAITALEAAVTEEDPVQGVAVVAEAAAAAAHPATTE